MDKLQYTGETIYLHGELSFFVLSNYTREGIPAINLPVAALNLIRN